MLNAAKNAKIKDDLQVSSKNVMFRGHTRSLQTLLAFLNLVKAAYQNTGVQPSCVDWTSVHNYARSKTMHATKRIQRTHSNPFSL